MTSDNELTLEKQHNELPLDFDDEMSPEEEDKLFYSAGQEPTEEEWKEIKKWLNIEQIATQRSDER